MGPKHPGPTVAVISKGKMKSLVANQSPFEVDSIS